MFNKFTAKVFCIRQNSGGTLDMPLRFVVVGRSFFSPSLGKPGALGSGTDYWRGYYQSLRPTQMGLSLNINVSTRAFYEPIPTIDFIESHFRANPSRANQAMVYDSIAAVLIPSAANTRNPRKKKRVRFFSIRFRF
ncbi:Protein argonaute 1D [Glycine max]|nr:Protein argonaute 1D [Glycine max]